MVHPILLHSSRPWGWRPRSSSRPDRSSTRPISCLRWQTRHHGWQGSLDGSTSPGPTWRRPSPGSVKEITGIVWSGSGIWFTTSPTPNGCFATMSYEGCPLWPKPDWFTTCWCGPGSCRQPPRWPGNSPGFISYSTTWPSLRSRPGRSSRGPPPSAGSPVSPMSPARCPAWSPKPTGRHGARTTWRHTSPHAVEMFGSDRLMWGSDWPVCTLAATYTEVFETTVEVLSDQVGDDVESILGGCAAATYGLAP